MQKVICFFCQLINVPTATNTVTHTEVTCTFIVWWNQYAALHQNFKYISPPFISSSRTYVCLCFPMVLQHDLAHEGLYLWEHLYSPGDEIVTRVNLFTVNSKSNKNKPHIICFMKLQKNNIAGIHLQRLYSDRGNMPLGITAINVQSIFFFSYLLLFVLIVSFCIHVLGWKDNSICYDGPLKTESKVCSSSFSVSKAFPAWTNIWNWSSWNQVLMSSQRSSSAVLIPWNTVDLSVES